MASKNQIMLGTVPIGGGAPVAVQTMTKTETANLSATMAQIHTVAEAGVLSSTAASVGIVAPPPRSSTLTTDQSRSAIARCTTPASRIGSTGS